VESLLRDWSGETVIIHRDLPTGAWILTAIHSTRLGPAAGGTRMKNYTDLRAAMQDVFRLAEGMTYKFSGAGANYGGGKTVIALPADFDPQLRTGLLRRYGGLVHQLGGLFYTAADVGTSAEDMDIIAETGAPYIFGRTPAGGGAGTSGPGTALGVFTGIQVVCDKLFGEASPKDRRVLVQGTGSVGGTLIEYLRAAGALVAFSEVDEAAIHRFRNELGLRFVPPGDLFAEECDVFSPCALGAILDADTTARLKCKAVVGGANNQLAEPEDAERLRARGILYAPDYVVNAGGALYVLAVESQGLTHKEAEQVVIDTVSRTLRRVLELAAQQGLTTEAAARQLAEERLAD
jgi:leucine dehydrogenase